MSVDSSPTLQIGFREFYRIIVPGAVSVLLIITIVPYLSTLGPFEKVLFSFLLGLITYSVGTFVRRGIFGKRSFDPFSHLFRSKILVLTQDIEAVCPGYQLTERGSRMIYKYFLENYAKSEIRERIHYFTSFFYMFMDLSLVSALYALSNLILLLVLSFDPVLAIQRVSGYGQAFAISYDFIQYKFALGMAASIICYLNARSILGDTIGEQRVLIRDQFKEGCELLAIAQAMEGEDIRKKGRQIELNAIVASALKQMVVDPDLKYEIASIKELDKADWKTGVQAKVAVVEIRTNNKTMLMGEPGNYKGSYKEKIETITEQILLEQGIHQHVHLEIVGKEGPLHRLVSIARAVEARIITTSSPLFETAQKYSIQHILIRGPHVEGPNPGLAEVVDETLSLKKYNAVLDLFSGTGLVTRIAIRKEISQIMSVDATTGNALRQIFNSPVEQERITFIQGDVFGLDLTKEFDLAVADPDFEDSMRVASELVPKLAQSCKTFILCHGFIEDRNWNEQVRKKLGEVCPRIIPVDRHGHSFTICHFS